MLKKYVFNSKKCVKFTIFKQTDSTVDFLQCGWTKTKLHCPHCGVRVGGVDFVGAFSHHVHLIRSKVDVVTSKIDVRRSGERPEEFSSAEESSSLEMSADEQSSVSPSPGTG